MDILSWVLGGVAVLINMLIYQQKGRKNLLYYKLASDVVWALYYLSAFAYPAMAIAIIGIFREIVFVNKEKKWAKSKLWFVFFILISIVSASLTWKNTFSILPAAASILSVIGFWIGNPTVSRIMALPISGCMGIYDVTNPAGVLYLGLVNEAMTVISVIVFAVHEAVKRAKQKDESKSVK